MYTGIEFVILRTELRADILAVVETEEASDPATAPVLELDCATPAAVWLYAPFLWSGQIYETPFFGWTEMVLAYPPLARDSFLNALLATLSLARDIRDKDLEESVIKEIDIVVRSSLLSADV